MAVRGRSGSRQGEAAGREPANDIERHRRRLHGCARRITIDLDPTDDPTHGQQQFSFFNSHYDGHCYLPVVCFLTFNEELEQHLVAAVLRPGNVSGSCGTIGILVRLLGRLDRAFPGVAIRIRLDGEFAAPEVWIFWTVSRELNMS